MEIHFYVFIRQTPASWNTDMFVVPTCALRLSPGSRALSDQPVAEVGYHSTITQPESKGSIKAVGEYVAEPPTLPSSL